MTVPAGTTNKVAYSGTTATSYPITFVFYESSDLKVYKTDALGVDTLLTITTNYTVTGGDGAVGTVTLLAAPLVTDTITIVRELPLEQGLDLANNDPFDADDVEEALDKITYRIQQVKEQADRSLTYSVTTPAADIESATDYIATLNTKVAAAQAAQSAAETAETNAETAETNAETAQSLAEAAQAAAEAAAASVITVDETHVWTAGQDVDTMALTSASSSVALDLSTGGAFTLAMTEDTTIAAPSNKPSGDDIRTTILIVTQHASSAKTLAWNTVFKFAGGSVPDLSTGASAVDVFTIVATSGNLLVTAAQDLK